MTAMLRISGLRYRLGKYLTEGTEHDIINFMIVSRLIATMS